MPKELPLCDFCVETGRSFCWNVHCHNALQRRYELGDAVNFVMDTDNLVHSGYISDVFPDRVFIRTVGYKRVGYTRVYLYQYNKYILNTSIKPSRTIRVG